MVNIHSNAVVSSKAKLGENVTVSPFAVIYDDVEIGDNTYIGPHACIYNGARIGSSVKIYQGASVAHNPQDKKFKEENTYFYIGDNTTIHEFCTLHKGTVETGRSSIGSNCLLMAYAHVAHDCEMGDNCVIANSVQIGGHVHIGDYVTIGGSTPVHQFCKVGRHSMIGGGFRIVQDIPPYILAGSEPLTFHGINLIGLRRRGFTNEDIFKIKDIYHIIYNSGMNLSQAKNKIRESYADDSFASEILGFIEQSDRGIIK